MENKNSKGITLVALVVTIILLLIIAGISIASIRGENSIINKTKKAKNEHEKAQAQESLATELASILANNEGNKDLKKLDNMKINGYTTKVSDIARLVTLTKNNETYNFLVDSNYNIQKLDNISGSNQNTGGGTNQGGSSDVINDFNIKLEEQTGCNIIINIDGEITTKDNSNIVGYVIQVDGKGTNVKEKMPISINLKDIGTKYKIDVIAIDIYGKTKTASSTLDVTIPNMIVEALQYPIMTTKGMVNTKYTNPSDSNEFFYGLDLSRDCTAADALDKAAYDGDDSTYYDGTSSKKKFYFGNDIDIYNVCFQIDPSYSGRLVTWLEGSGNINTSEGKFLKLGIFHTTYYGKNNISWKNWFIEINCKLYEIYYDANL